VELNFNGMPINLMGVSFNAPSRAHQQAFIITAKSQQDGQLKATQPFASKLAIHLSWELLKIQLQARFG